MSELTESLSSETAARRFRARVLKPAEGVFLFHPRAMERLLAEHLGPGGYEGSIPALDYAVMPREDFLQALETENPEALAVIEGLELPAQVILLPLPTEQRLSQVAFTLLLRRYWARRFEAEVARAWQAARDARADAEAFGAEALASRIGAAALAEVRDVLTRDGVIPAAVCDALLCRGFVALVARLRYFAPGARALYFPAIRDWSVLDAWMAAGGLDLPAPAEGVPALLESSRPDPACGDPAMRLALPSHLPYLQGDPDLGTRPDPEARTTREAWPLERLPAPDQKASGAETLAPSIERRCLDALREALEPAREDWRTPLRDAALTLARPLLSLLLSLGLLLGRKGWSHVLGRRVAMAAYLPLFRHSVRMSRRFELSTRHTSALIQLGRARRLFQTMGQPSATDAAQVLDLLAEHCARIQDSMSRQLAQCWTLPAALDQELRLLIRELGRQCAVATRPRTARLLLRDLERVRMESGAIYFRLRPLAWILTLGRVKLRQILPFQALLKALRALDAANNRLEASDWPASEVERHGATLGALSRTLGERLQDLLEPHLHDALRASGFSPRNHREQVAAHKMLRELLDVIRHRHHLKFTDVRDIVARNILRLPDPDWDDLLGGDRLAHFDQAAARALPGVYKPGELYIKGLQQLSAPLFGTSRGRLLLRHLIVPLGLAFLGLKTLDLLVGLILPPESLVKLAPLWLVSLVALLINAILYTDFGRRGARILLRGLWSTLRLLLWEGVRHFLRWPPVARLLSTRLARGLDRQLLRPLLIGSLLVLPFVALGGLFENNAFQPDAALLALAFTLGTLAHNTPLGRHLVDEASSTLALFLRRLNQTLIIGLVQVLLELFKELTRRFQQALHRIEELLSHHLGESRLELAIKALLAPLWNIVQALIQFYVTVLVEPQINPIKHFPLVTIAHKLLLPFLPAITSMLVQLTNSILPAIIAYPIATLTVLLLPGLAGFLVWELKENWKLYAANHTDPSTPEGRQRLESETGVTIEQAVVGTHGESMRAILRRGFHSGTLPKAFDQMRRGLREQLREQQPAPRRMREARRQLAEIERALCVFTDRELGYPLRLRCQNPGCTLTHIETCPPRLAINACELGLLLYGARAPEGTALRLRIHIELLEPDLRWRLDVEGPPLLGPTCWRLVAEDLRIFAERAGIRHAPIPAQLSS
ncbi:MAG: sulfite exporter TauE/SafE family protein [Chromatiaceae bacterium]|nr:sulfite exporter TauE/SafE family protein [Chromatiaceae bacterium]